MVVLGIDLGADSCRAACWQQGRCRLIPNEYGEYETPAALVVQEDGCVRAGRPALEALPTRPQGVLCDFKGEMGTTRQHTLGGKELQAEALSGLVLRQIKNDALAALGDEPVASVVGVPAGYDDNQRCAVRIAARLAGLDPTVLLCEPAAAAMAHIAAAGRRGQRLLVISLGLHTLEVSAVELYGKELDMVSLAREDLGGDDFTRVLEERFFSDNGIDPASLTPAEACLVHARAEQCKRALGLRQAAGFTVPLGGVQRGLMLHLAEYHALCAPLLERLRPPVVRALQEAGLRMADIDDIVLAGGGVKLPLVRRHLEVLAGRYLRPAVDPARAVALGCGIVAGMAEGAPGLGDLTVRDICPFTLGVGMSGEVLSPIIERGTPLPASRSHVYCTTADGQTLLGIRIFRGENRSVGDNVPVGELQVEVPPASAGKEGATLRLTYDLDGILDVEATVISTGQVVRKLIINNNLHLEKEELRRRIDRLQELKTPPREKERNRCLLARGERLYAESLKETRDRIGSILSYFEVLLDTQDERRISQAYQAISEMFDELERDKGDNLFS